MAGLIADTEIMFGGQGPIRITRDPHGQAVVAAITFCHFSPSSL